MLSHSTVLGKSGPGWLEVFSQKDQALGQHLLLPLVKWLDEGGVHPANNTERQILNGLRQNLASCCVTDNEAQLSTQLYELAQKYVHHSTFGPFAQKLLEVIASSPLSHAARAQEQINILNGGGSFLQQIQSTGLRMVRSGELPAMAFTMMGAGALGNSMGWMVSRGLKTSSWGARLGFWGRSVGSTVSKVLVEGSVFHPLHQSALCAMGRDVEIFSGFAKHWGDGVALMAALNLGGAASALGRNAFHATKIVNGVSVATQFRSLSAMTSVMAPIIGESSALLGLGFFREEGSPHQIIANALGFMVESRLAGSLGHTFAPMAYHLQNRMRLETYQNLRQQAHHTLRSLSSKFPGRPNSQSRSSAWQWAVQGMGASGRVASSVESKTSDNPLKGPVLALNHGQAATSAVAPPADENTVEERAPEPPTAQEITSTYELAGLDLHTFEINENDAITGSNVTPNQPYPSRFVKVETPWGPSTTVSHVGPYLGIREGKNKNNFAHGINRHGLWFIVCEGKDYKGAGGEVASHTMVESTARFMKRGYPLVEAVEQAKQEVRAGHSSLAGYQMYARRDGTPTKITLVSVGYSGVSILRPSNPKSPIVASTQAQNLGYYLEAFMGMEDIELRDFKRLDPEGYKTLLEAKEMLPPRITPEHPHWPLWVEAHPMSDQLIRGLGPTEHTHVYNPQTKSLIRANDTVVQTAPIQSRDVLYAYSHGAKIPTPDLLLDLRRHSPQEALVTGYKQVLDRQILAWQAEREGDIVSINDQTYRKHPSKPIYLWVDPNTRRTWPLFFSKNSSTEELQPSYAPALNNFTANLLYLDGPKGSGRSLFSSLVDDWALV